MSEIAQDLTPTADAAIASADTKPSTDAATVKPSFRVLKVGSCPSLSARSTLTYQVACTSDGDLLLRLVSNTGNGVFSKEWVRFALMDELLVADAPLTFGTLQPLFKGLSVNTGGFLLAVLKSLNVIRPNADNPRVNDRGDVESFLSELRALMASSVSLGEDARPDAPKGRRKVITLPKGAAAS